MKDLNKITFTFEKAEKVFFIIIIIWSLLFVFPFLYNLFF